MINNSEYVEKFVELFLYYLDSNSLVIELCSLIGIENTIKVMEIFGGTTISIPSMKILRKAYRNIDIYLSLSKNDSINTKSHLSKKHNLQIKSVDVLYREVKRIMTQDDIMLNYLKKIGLEKETKNVNLDIDSLLLSDLDTNKIIKTDRDALNLEDPVEEHIEDFIEDVKTEITEITEDILEEIIEEIVKEKENIEINKEEIS